MKRGWYGYGHRTHYNSYNRGSGRRFIPWPSSFASVNLYYFTRSPAVSMACRPRSVRIDWIFDVVFLVHERSLFLQRATNRQFSAIGNDNFRISFPIVLPRPLPVHANNQIDDAYFIISICFNYVTLYVNADYLLGPKKRTSFYRMSSLIIYIHFLLRNKIVF